MSLSEKFVAFIKKENLFRPTDKLLLAVSGGIDSVVLCELCKIAGYNFAIAHCNFQLRGAASDTDEQFVKQLAKKYAVNFYVKKIETLAAAVAKKKSVEETARDLRYEWFELLRVENRYDHIVTAHHADDNIETVTMNFFRGTGIKGVRGILPKQHKIVRPLLFARRLELENFLSQYQLAFVTDHTNAENDYTRNFFRNEILPMISRSFPGAKENVLKNIQRFKETETLYRQAVDSYIKKLLEYKGKEVHIPVLKLLKTVPLHTIVYEIIKDYGFTAHQTEEAMALLNSETGKYVESATHRIIKNRNWLIIAPVSAKEATHILIEKTDIKITFQAGELAIEKFNAANLAFASDASTAILDAGEIIFPLLLRKWKQGDYFYPLGMKKKKKINRFLSDQKLSITQKENTWVVEMNKKILWVIGMRIDDRFKVVDATQQVLKFKFNK